ncbi:hypothetical protein [Floccifex porci]|uniref:Uncharacterized protein n=1 Tax=Floccifex porci TaxID=2606629 RepID=A0A7X2T359_9FIRM|nr:hypothetical protein [Floccifex porci]MSS01082.1 hypothetical protein [Floccifex porci]
MKSVISRKTYIFIFFVILFLAQNRLQQWAGVFQYLDELFALLIIPALLYWIIKKKEKVTWTKQQICFFALLAIFWLSGWGGYVIYHYQPLSNAAKDAYVNLKFFLAAGASFLIFADKELNFEQLKKKLWPVLNGIVVILFVFCLADLCFGIFSKETRYGMRAIKLFYSAYTILVGECVFLSAIYLWFFEQKRKKIIPPLVMLAFIMLSTRRIKSVGAVACILMVYLLVFYKEKKLSKKVKIFTGCVLLIALFAGVYQVISYYIMMGTESARAVLTIGAPFIAKDHFPFGSGWGTYGSAFSADPYSPVYGMYQMDGVWGISPEYHEFVSDTFWPMILGECGIFGLLAFIGVCALIVKKVFILKSSKSAFASSLIPLLYLLISSSSESAFANPIAVPFAFWMGFLFAEQYVKESKDRGLDCEIKSKIDKSLQ